MSRVDIFLLAIMSCKNKLSLSNIVEKVRIANISNPPSRLAIYKRLHVLKNQQLINTSWREREKIYTISATGILVITEFKNQLNKAQSA